MPNESGCKFQCKLLHDIEYTCTHYSFYYVQVMDSLVQVGSCGDICVQADSFGVVHLSASKIITCATCRYGKTSCLHVHKLTQVLSKFATEEVPLILLPYTHALNSDAITPKKKYSTLTCVSTQKTPFHLPQGMCAIIAKTISERFNFADGTALLHPDNNSSACSSCGLSNWIEDSAFVKNAKLVDSS